RLALSALNDSGCGGAGCCRFQGEKSEDIAAILKNFRFWFQPHFADFIGNTDRLPFDQHTVKALVAPRALLSTEALGDLWANPRGTQQSHAAAKEVFAFLGAADRIGIHFRTGGHKHRPEDWATLLDFADWQFFGRTVVARLSFDGGTGRFSRIGVATSPGSSDVARMPFTHSSMLIVSDSAITPRLVAL